MRLVAKQDVEAPASFVFGQVVDFDAWERAAMRRGADVQRSDKPAMPGPGTTWDVQFDYRGKLRKLRIGLEKMAHPTSLVLSARSAPTDAEVQVEVVDMAARRTRVEVRLEIKPKSLAARIFIQSLRLARSRVERTFDQRVARLAAEIEDRYRRSQRPA